MTPDDTIKGLEQAYNRLQIEYSKVLDEKEELTAELRRTAAVAKTAQHQVAVLRAGLTFYAPGPFWETVLKGTKADEDQGKHAEWVLRMTADGNDPVGA